jgi:hypothetical protein
MEWYSIGWRIQGYKGYKGYKGYEAETRDARG